MKKNAIVVDGMNKALVMTKVFYKKACLFGSEEYYELRKAQAENEGFEIAFKFADKETHRGLTFKRMADYIKTQPDADARMMEFEAVQKIAKAKGAMYPLTKEWFFLTYPQFKKDEVSADEQAFVLNEMKKLAEAEAEKKLAAIVGEVLPKVA